MAGFRSFQERGKESPFRQDHHDIVPYADLVEEPHLLKGPRDTVAGRLVSLQDPKADAVDYYDSAVEGQHPAQQVHQGRFPRSVWPNDAGYPLPEDGHREPVHGLNRTEVL